MSGFEAVGLVLAVLPLLVATVEHYDDVLRPFKRYKNFDSEIKRFKNELSSEQVIFHAESLLLLASITGYDVAAKMLEDRDHPSWKDFELEVKLANFLGSSFEACKNIVGLIDEDLSKIREESRFFDVAVCGLSVSTEPSDKLAWRQRLGRKLKWSLSQSQLEKQLKELRRHVKNFQRHSSQINKVADKHENVKHDQKQVSTTQTVAECRLVQGAAAELYLALINACKAHHEHILHFRLQTCHSPDTGRPSVRFQMAFVQSVLDADPNPIWVAIESEFGNPTVILGKCGMENVANSVETLRNQLKRPCDSTASQSQSKKPQSNTQKSARFAPGGVDDSDSSIASYQFMKPNLKEAMFSPSWNATPARLLESSSVSGSENSKSESDTVAQLSFESSISALSSERRQTSSLDGLLPNFCQQHDLCKHIDKWSKTSLKTTDTCIGYLRRERASSHRVLVTPQVSNRTRTPISLAQLISSSPNQSYPSRFLYMDSIRLAKQLASAILLFHATPILRETWQSEDIVFYDTTLTLKRHRPSLTDPHLSVRITSTEAASHSQILSKSQGKALSYDKRIRNHYTYRLGIILLELACQAPLCKLREEEDLIGSAEGPKTDFEVANSISETLSTDMGIPFQKMVQKCLNCDFGSGSNLRDPELQVAFHKDIVCGLENIESRLKGLQLGE